MIASLNVEPERDDAAAALDDVFFAFDAELAGFAGFDVGADGVDRWPYVTHCAHMTTITIRELHMKTGQWVRAAARGKRGLLVLDRGRPAARLVPAEDKAGVDFSERKLVRGFDRLPELSVDSARFLEEDRR
ncbi:MAG: type II toxin-antitoxin system Phd/YefM family antitoxin [Chthoniobacterales bacterium]